MNELADTDRAKIAEFCQRHRVRRLTRLLEPVRTGPDAGSEAAFLIEFTRDDTPSLSKLAAMESAITGILGRPIDLHLYIRDLCLWNTPGVGRIEYDRADYMEIAMPPEKIADFCRRNRIKWLASLPHPSRASIIRVADVGFLAEFEPGAKIGWGTIGIADELGELLGCFVDIHQTRDIESTKLKAMLDSATVQYERQ